MKFLLLCSLYFISLYWRSQWGLHKGFPLCWGLGQSPIRVATAWGVGFRSLFSQLIKPQVLKKRLVKTHYLNLDLIIGENYEKDKNC